DTIQVLEEMRESSGCAVEWFPLGNARAKAYWWGGGEGDCPMRSLDSCPWGEESAGAGREVKVLQRLSHISYFNQWNAAWAGFSCGDERFVGVFSGWGGLWRRR